MDKFLKGSSCSKYIQINFFLQNACCKMKYCNQILIKGENCNNIMKFKKYCDQILTQIEIQIYFEPF